VDINRILCSVDGFMLYALENVKKMRFVARVDGYFCGKLVRGVIKNVTEYRARVLCC